MQLYQMLQWEVISPRERRILTDVLFTGSTPNGENCEMDIVVEKAIGYVTYSLLGKNTHVAGSTRTRETMGKVKELTETRFGDKKRPAVEAPWQQRERSGLITVQFQDGRNFLHDTGIGTVGAKLTLAKGKGKAKACNASSFVSPLDQREISPLLLVFEQLGLERLRGRAALEVLSAAYDKPDRPGATSAYPKLDCYTDEVLKRREFELKRATTDDARTMADSKLHGQTGESLFTCATLAAAISAEQAAVGGPAVTPEELGGKRRPELCEQLSKLRREHPGLVSAARARFGRGEGYTTQLPKLVATRDGSGPAVEFAGVTRSPLEMDLVQLRAMRAMESKQYAISALLPRRASAPAADAAGSASPATARRAAVLFEAELHAAAAMAETRGDASDGARAKRPAATAAAFSQATAAAFSMAEAAEAAAALRRSQPRPPQ